MLFRSLKFRSRISNILVVIIGMLEATIILDFLPVSQITVAV